MVVGLAVTVAPVVADKPVDGDQLYVEAPLAVNDMLLPVQIAAEEGDIVIVGKGLITTVTELLDVQVVTGSV